MPACVVVIRIWIEWNYLLDEIYYFTDCNHLFINITQTILFWQRFFSCVRSSFYVLNFCLFSFQSNIWLLLLIALGKKKFWILSGEGSSHLPANKSIIFNFTHENTFLLYTQWRKNTKTLYQSKRQVKTKQKHVAKNEQNENY